MVLYNLKIGGRADVYAIDSGSLRLRSGKMADDKEWNCTFHDFISDNGEWRMMSDVELV